MDGKAEETSDVSNPDPNFSDFSLNFEIPGSSSSLSFPSEPPDIRNWFSSYIYESPSLDTENEFEAESGAAEAVGTKKLGQERRKDEPRVRVSDYEGEVFGGDAERQDCSENKENHFIEADVVTSNIGESQNVEEPSKDVSSPFKEDVAPCSENEYSSAAHRMRTTSSGNLLKREQYKRENSRGTHREEDDLLSCQRNADFGSSDGTSFKASMLRTTDCKEEGNELKENGFVLVKKKKHTSENGLGAPHRISQMNHATHEMHKTVERRPFSERTNTPFDVEVSETAGKWRCPQKTKPDYGPPMKQLRLERWVHRV